jgi:hypothetical protein
MRLPHTQVRCSNRSSTRSKQPTNELHGWQSYPYLSDCAIVAISCPIRLCHSPRPLLHFFDRVQCGKPLRHEQVLGEPTTSACTKFTGTRPRSWRSIWGSRAHSSACCSVVLGLMNFDTPSARTTLTGMATKTAKFGTAMIVMRCHAIRSCMLVSRLQSQREHQQTNICGYTQRCQHGHDIATSSEFLAVQSIFADFGKELFVSCHYHKHLRCATAQKVLRGCSTHLAVA